MPMLSGLPGQANHHQGHRISASNSKAAKRIYSRNFLLISANLRNPALLTTPPVFIGFRLPKFPNQFSVLMIQGDGNQPSERTKMATANNSTETLLNEHDVGRITGARCALDRSTQIAYSKECMASVPMTVVETERFLKDAGSLLSDSERAELVAFIGASPEEGKVIPETGGVRKIRWALPGRRCLEGGSAAARGWSIITTAGACRCSCWAHTPRTRRRISRR